MSGLSTWGVQDGQERGVAAAAGLGAAGQIGEVEAPGQFGDPQHIAATGSVDGREVHGSLGHDAGAVGGGVGVHRQDGRVRDADAAGTGAQVVIDKLAEALIGVDRYRHVLGQGAASIGGIQVGNVDPAGVAGGIIQREPLGEAIAGAPFGKVPRLKHRPGLHFRRWCRRR